MRIAIVDDDYFFAETVAGKIREFFSMRGESLDIRCQGGNVLLGELKNQKNFDVYLIDVEMPEMDGLELARQVKQLDVDSRIIFLTGYDKYALQGIRQGVYYYILKDEYWGELSSILERICKEEEETKEEYYFITTETHGCKIAINRILYLIKEKKYTVFHCKDGAVYKERDSLNNIIQRLPEGRFIPINRGIVVNMKYIIQFEKMDITIQNGEKLPISKYLRVQVRDRLADYWKR